MDSKLAVLAIGGNSLIKDRNHVALFWQYEAVKQTSKHVVDLIAEGLSIVITHGNGPQVGLLYNRGCFAPGEPSFIPLDICGADTQGAMGYMIQKTILNEFHKRGMEKKIATVVTQTVVDKDDPSFQHPTKPIGLFMPEEQALTSRREFGWQVVEDADRGFRRVVPSPVPREIIELDMINLLVEKGYVVIAAGGGGIPVIRNEHGEVEGVEAVIDKDLTSFLLAVMLGADTLIISTAVDAIYLNFGKADQKPIGRAALSEMKRYLAEGQFEPGSMRPKIEAIIQFLESGGSKAVVTSPENILKAIRGECGTTIVR